jgi:hypothetical protein
MFHVDRAFWPSLANTAFSAAAARQNKKPGQKEKMDIRVAAQP